MDYISSPVFKWPPTDECILMDCQHRSLPKRDFGHILYNSNLGRPPAPPNTMQDVGPKVLASSSLGSSTGYLHLDQRHYYQIYVPKHILIYILHCTQFFNVQIVCMTKHIWSTFPVRDYYTRDLYKHIFSPFYGGPRSKITNICTTSPVQYISDPFQ